MSIKYISENEIIFARLLNYFSENNINQAKFIEITGYSSGQASAIFNRKANLNKRLVKTICKAFSLSEKWLLTGGGAAFDKEGETSLFPLEGELTPEDQLLWEETRELTRDQKLELILKARQWKRGQKVS